MRLVPRLLLLVGLALPVFAAGKSNTIVMKPGEVIYARFEPSGKKIKLVSASQEKDDHAQVIFSTSKDPVTFEVKLKVENKFPEDFTYKLVIHLRKLDRESPEEVSAVVGGKVAFESFPFLTDELTFSNFELQR